MACFGDDKGGFDDPDFDPNEGGDDDFNKFSIVRLSKIIRHKGFCSLLDQAWEIDSVSRSLTEHVRLREIAKALDIYNAGDRDKAIALLSGVNEVCEENICNDDCDNSESMIRSARWMLLDTCLPCEPLWQSESTQ